MANTISISPEPGIKCCAWDKFCDIEFHSTAKVTPERFRKLIDEEILLTGESTQCVCSHHVEQHCTRDHCDRTIKRHCHGSNELCNCKFFMAHSIRLSHSNCYKMVTEREADDLEVRDLPNSNNEVKNQ
jgi:hypothetical protein